MNAATRCGSCRTEGPPGARFCPGCGTPLAAATPSGDSRRIVTAVFIDLVGSTVLAETLDPEALRHTMDRYYRACTRAVTERGGVVEKFIGDAVMAVFGAFVSHEDDALHAVRAALAVREAVADIATGDGVRLDVHCGIASGEAVVAGALGGAARVVGDVVHTAARLQSHARTHEILIGEETARLAGAGIRTEPVAPLTLKGKRDPVPARRVLGLPVDDRPRDLVPLTGRDHELRLVRAEFDTARRERGSRRVTVTGPTGIGKSRLVRAFLAGPDTAGATVLRGTCRPHGTGSAHRPLAEAVWSLPGGREAAAAALRDHADHGERALAALGVALGTPTGHAGPLGEEAIPPSVEETDWAFRSLLEALGRDTPVVLVLEDYQWAQPTLLDTIAGLSADTTGTTDTALLTLCVARTDDGGPPGSGTTPGLHLDLGPLSRPDTELLVARLADRGEVTAQEAGPRAPHLSDALAAVVRECDGNPLYAELLLEDRAARPAEAGVPTTIRVLLTAWLDRLPAADRAVLERAAGAGATFTAEDVRTLAADTPALTPEVLADALDRLQRTRVVHPDGPPGSYRFTRTLARDTLYEMTSKLRRADWHTVLADRLDTAPPTGPGPAPEGDLAHHLESASRLLAEAGPGDPRLPALTLRAARALTASGYRALHRRDLPAALALMERGRTLTPDGDPAHRVIAARVTDAYAALGRWDSARAAVAEADRRTPGDPAARATCAALRALIALRSGAPAPADPGPRPAPEDHLSRCRHHQLASLGHFAEGRTGAAESAMREALVHARQLGDAYEENRVLVSLCELTQWSPAPLAGALALCEDLAGRFDADRGLLVPVLLTRARHRALSGHLDRAREDVALARRHSADLALTLGGIAADQTAGLVESLAGEHPEAARHYAAAATGLTVLGQTRTAATLRLYAARERFRSGAAADPAALAEFPPGTPADTRTRAVRLSLLAAVRARAGAHPEAVAAARAAAALLDRTDDPYLTGEVWFEAARVLDAAGDPTAARAAARRALDALTAKGAVLPAGAVRAWLTARPG
ncbi:AAA family ATPase [Streptomyces sp. NPDC097619]|uniref:AAA family ATPase n=1 Tax=Streptomyces sp. NPDC097619 TaxID=3157228 RepID=UPI003324726A